MEQTTEAYIVIAEFTVASEHRDEFLKLCEFDSLRSRTDEPGCHQFDVITAENSPELVALYEVYDDRAAFDVHLSMPHFAIFAEGLERMGVTKHVRFFTRQSC